MGTSIPTEAAPAYEELFAGHERPGNTSSGYTSIPQADLLQPEEIDIEQQQQQSDDVHLHQHQHTEDGDRVDRGEGHIHCTACDRLLERKEQRINQRHCCTMVAVTFMVIFICLMVLGFGITVAIKH
ncbi:uncharacterized protein BHQ10_009826 [Talaromyces amestolkiae]|uniref:LITAF domain-containing protein n=1 Tax=Talaromyces amestolkiae TaxID=1196081 RepID=A0A364LDC6_TALAM|nr:uncharacterized protein BHQ10_009826 [Talaromyces amestolkiae]RAO73814.1 hypothetical protein BHQ10_009826 [Talaromyces amestolkiae]